MQCGCNGTDKQKFRFVKLPDGFDKYYIMNKASNKFIDIYNAGMEDEVKVIQWSANKGENQVFLLFWVEGDRYNIISSFSRKLIDVPGGSMNDSVALIQYTANGKINQLFEIKAVE
jgi:hypothetical protein